MTGFGKSSLQLPSKKIIVEIKSLNSKGLDLNVRIPSGFKEVELGIRNQVMQVLERGKIDVAIYLEAISEETTNKINIPIVKDYIKQMQQIYTDADGTELLKMAVRMPEALKVEREEVNKDDWTKIQEVLQEALVNIVDFRKSEGKSLENEFLLRITNIRTYLEQAIALDPERINLIKNKLQNAISELKVTVDENRFEQELIYYLEKLDITEERVRLDNHLNYFLETINSTEANGRKLGFITQEMGREINTLGSKSNHAAMQKLVVMMKDELEKIKEQVLNVL
jgi:uncharacterized protein (TIGR00255 family)